MIVSTGTRVLVIALLSHQLLFAQDNSMLPLRRVPAADATILNTISFKIPTGELNGLHASKGKKLALKMEEIVVNGETQKVKHAHVRGQTSSYFRRKSFNIKTNSKSSFYTRADTFSLSKFYAISMNMDHNYIHNKISYDVMKLVGVHAPLNCYSEILINSGSEGLYLIFYPPDDYAIKYQKARVVIRRGYDESMDKVSAAKEVDQHEVKDLKKKFRQLYAPSTLNKEGEELFKEISKVLDLNSYFSWLAFNHLFQNGDYADEAYFMWNAKMSRFEVVPWDFDDILKSQPHEGIEERDKVQTDKLIFSLEDALDKKIASDQVLYKRYLAAYVTLLDTLTADKLKQVLVGVYNDVYPYYLKEGIIAQSQYDQYGQTDLTKLEADLNSIYRYISMKTIELRKEIETSSR